MDEAAARFSAKGLFATRLHVLAGNKDAIAFYEAAGFSRYEVVFRKGL